jgi:integrase
MPTPTRNRLTDPDLADFLDEVDWAPTTKIVVHGNLCRWERWLVAHGRAVLDADFRDLRAYLAARETAGIGGSTRHKDWQHVRQFYGWAATKLEDGGPELLGADPMLRAKAPRIGETKVRTATADVATTLIRHSLDVARHHGNSPAGIVALRDAAIVAVLFRSGVRSCEAAGLDVDGLVRDDTGAIVGAHVPAAYAKTRRSRLVPLTGEAPRLLRRYLARRPRAGGPLFVSRQAGRAGDGRMTPQAIQGAVRRAAKACGVAVSPHDFRRGWAVTMGDAGIERGHIKLAGGWAKDTTLNRYLGPDAQRIAVEDILSTLGGAKVPRLRAVAR